MAETPAAPPAAKPKKPAKQEQIKEESQHLRGNLAAELADDNEFVSNASYELLKFHGSYQGYDRDSATERKQQGLDKRHEFMLRLKMPGGRLSAEQYLAMDKLVDKFANGTLRITTRETFQFHCIIKDNMKPLIADINRTMLSTLGGCGDVVRNINTSSAPIKDAIHAKLEEDAYALAKHFAPRTDGYLDVWLDGESVEGWGSVKNEVTLAPNDSDDPVEPLYGTHYLPRKFKIGLGLPEDNSNDLLTNDVALVAVREGDTLHGYNMYLGGGLGMQHNNAKTFPRLASPVAFIPVDDMLLATEAVVKLQRDFGDRTNRRNARLKYVMEEKGDAWVRQTLHEYAGKAFDDVRPTPDFAVPDLMGWHEQGDGKWWLGIPIPSGRITNYHKSKLREGLREVIAQYGMPIILTADQNLILYDIAKSDKNDIVAKLKAHNIRLREDWSEVDRWSLACVALPTCGKALAEAERVREPLIVQAEKSLEKLGLLEKRIRISISGCPNGCSRPYTGEIGLVGRTPGHYAIFIGADFEGTRLNEKIFDKVPLEQVPTALEAMFGLYKEQAANDDEMFGDFCMRIGTEAMHEVAKVALYEKFNWTV